MEEDASFILFQQRKKGIQKYSAKVLLTGEKRGREREEQQQFSQDVSIHEFASNTWTEYVDSMHHIVVEQRVRMFCPEPQRFFLFFSPVFSDSQED